MAAKSTQTEWEDHTSVNAAETLEVACEFLAHASVCDSVERRTHINVFSCRKLSSQPKRTRMPFHRDTATETQRLARGLKWLLSAVVEFAINQKNTASTTHC